jgi:addiction module RelE/StbE family toxin
MVQVTARLPDALGAELDAAAAQLSRCRADIIRQAIEYYLDDIEDLRCGVAALKDPADPVLNWAEVRVAEGLSRSESRCSLRIKRSAAKALASLPKVERERLVEAIDLLCDTPAAGSALKGEFEGLRRLRVGHYRVVYEWQRNDLVILVVRIGHRREVYR